MFVDPKVELSIFFEDLASTLDISPTQARQAEERYKSIGRWLGREQSAIRRLTPDIYPQGSFELGTVVKPITDAEEYDIDLVCELSLSKQKVSQKGLKHLVGDEIKSYITGNNIDSPAEETNRCWRMNYADGAQFHMDTLPAIPDGNNFKTLLADTGISNLWSDSVIAITDTMWPSYDKVSEDWPQSNPRGYAQWFRTRMATEFMARQVRLAEALQKSVQAISRYEVKTPLQQSIQILKRHRDMFFANDLEHRPISSIISTLAAWAYNNESDLLVALTNIVRSMDRFITVRNGISWIANPANPLENFAEKWQIYPKRKKNFYDWLGTVRSDIEKAQYAKSAQAFSESVRARFGEQTLKKALGRSVERSTSRTIIYKSRATNLLSKFSVPHREQPKWPIVVQGRASISAVALRNGFRPFSFQSDSSPLDKRCSLTFEASTDVTPPYKVYWQVVNTGEEARLANGLRGDFYDGLFEKGGRTRKESTLYHGMHWVECFIVKNGICVARSGEFVVNIK